MSSQERLEKQLEAFAEAGGIETKDLLPMLPGEVVWSVNEMKNFVVEHAIVPQNEELSKIVFHVKKLSPVVMDTLSLFLHDEITKKMKPPALVEAGHSPVYRDQWDLVLFHLPKFRASMVRDAILSAMSRFSM